MVDKLTPKKIEQFRKYVDKSIKDINRKKVRGYIVMKGGKPDPRFTYKIDNKTGRVVLKYSIPVQDNSTKKKYRKVRKDKYLSSVTIENYKDNLDVLADYEFVVKSNEEAINLLYVDEGSLEYWVEWYCDFERRREEWILEEDAVKPSTLEGYDFYLGCYMKWLKENKPKFLSLASHNSPEGVETFYEFLRHKSDTSWNSTTLNNMYTNLRGLFNWLSRKEENKWFDSQRWSKLDKIPKPKPNKSNFTPQEFRKLIEFMDENREHKNWFWMIKILRVMLVTGCRISEVVTMKINELQSQTIDGRKVWRWNFFGKGRGKGKNRTIYIDSEHAYQDILKLITNDKGNIRTDKEFVFHRHFYKSSNPNQESMGSGFVERLDLPYSKSGVQHKFKKMVRHLGLNDKLTPHSCRRFFIQEKLRETSGDLNLVRILVGHSSLKMVMNYHQTDQEYNTLIDVRNTLDFEKVRERNERVI